MEASQSSTAARHGTVQNKDPSFSDVVLRSLDRANHAKMPNGDPVTIVGTTDDEYQVVWRSKQGWVKKHHIQADSAEEIKPVTEPNTSSEVVKVTDPHAAETLRDKTAYEAKPKEESNIANQSQADSADEIEPVAEPRILNTSSEVVKAKIWIKCDGLPAHEGKTHPGIKTHGIDTIEAMRNACMNVSDCVGFAYRPAQEGLEQKWYPKQRGTGFDPDTTTVFFQQEQGEQWEWHYIGSAGTKAEAADILPGGLAARLRPVDTVQWMWGDATIMGSVFQECGHSFARKNPLRWSSWIQLGAAIVDLRKYKDSKDNNRLVLIRTQRAMEILSFVNVEEALLALQEQVTVADVQRAKLRNTSLRDLRRIAIQKGINSDDIDACDEQRRPMEAIISLIMKQANPIEEFYAAAEHYKAEAPKPAAEPQKATSEQVKLIEKLRTFFETLPNKERIDGATIEGLVMMGLTEVAIKKLLLSEESQKACLMTHQDSLECIISCIELGAKMTSSAANEHVVYVIGFTGAGKSTTINYLLGCEMQEVDSKSLGMAIFQKTVITVKEGPQNKEVAKIGHNRFSTTFIPEIAQKKLPVTEHEHLLACDMPGFLDSRGAEINIANAVNTMQTFRGSKTARLLVIIDYPALETARGQAFTKLVTILRMVFGDDEGITKNGRSLILAITKAKEDVELASIKAAFADEPGYLRSITKRIILLDPLEKHPDHTNKRDLLQKIWELPAIEDTKSVFHTALTSEDLASLDEFVSPSHQEIEDALKNKKYQEVKPVIEDLQKLRCLPHLRVAEIVYDATKKIYQNLSKMNESILANIVKYKGGALDVREELQKQFQDFADAAVLDPLLDDFPDARFQNKLNEHKDDVTVFETAQAGEACEKKRNDLEFALKKVGDELVLKATTHTEQMLSLQQTIDEDPNTPADKIADHLANWEGFRACQKSLQDVITAMKGNLFYKSFPKLEKLLSDQTKKAKSILTETIDIASCRDDEKFNDKLKNIQTEIMSGVLSRIVRVHEKVLQIPDKDKAGTQERAKEVEEVFALCRESEMPSFLLSSSCLNATKERLDKVDKTLEEIIVCLKKEALSAQKTRKKEILVEEIENLYKSEISTTVEKHFASIIKKLRQKLQELADMDSQKCRDIVDWLERPLSGLAVSVPLRMSKSEQATARIIAMFESKQYSNLSQLLQCAKAINAPPTTIKCAKEDLAVLAVDIELIKTTLRAQITSRREEAARELAHIGSTELDVNTCAKLRRYSDMVDDLISGCPEFLPTEEADPDNGNGIGRAVLKRLDDFEDALATILGQAPKNLENGHNFLIYSCVIFFTFRKGAYIKHFDEKAISVLDKLESHDLRIISTVLSATKSRFSNTIGSSAGVITTSIRHMIDQYPCFASLSLKLLNDKIKAKRAQQVVSELSPVANVPGSQNQAIDEKVLVDSTEQVMTRWKTIFARHFPASNCQDAHSVETTINDVKQNVKRIRSKLSESMVKGSDINAKGNEKDICEMVSLIFAMWTLVESGEAVRRGDQDCYYMPHAAQVVAILVLLGVGTGQAMRNHVAEIGTGEGKSVILGMLATFLSLIGCHVHVVCYSALLSERDQNLFQGVFDQFEVRPVYNSIIGMAKDMVDQKYDCQRLARQLLSEGKCSETSVGQDYTRSTLVPSESREISVLLIDEVDVFFGKDFYGNAMGRLIVLDDECCVKLVEYVYNNKDKKQSVTTVMDSSEAKQVQNAFPGFGDLLKSEVTKMLSDLKDIAKHECDVNEARTAIGYVNREEGGIAAWNRHRGYKTMFQALEKLDHKKRKNWKTRIGIRLKLGSVPYAATPDFFGLKLGLSGTLSHMSEHEFKILSESYEIKQFTKFGSLFQKGTVVEGEIKESKLKINQTVVCLGKQDDEYFQAIQHVMNTERRKRRSTEGAAGAALVVFKDEKKCDEFQSWASTKHTETGGTFGMAITPRLLMRPGQFDTSVAMAATAGRWTLMSREFGRGTDFKCGDSEVVSAGGMHVVLTFPCEFYAEQIQIRGRTCRQDDPGEFTKIYHVEDLIFLTKKGCWPPIEKESLSVPKSLDEALGLTTKEGHGYKLTDDQDRRIEQALRKFIEIDVPKIDNNPKNYQAMKDFCASVEAGNNDDAKRILGELNGMG